MSVAVIPVCVCVCVCERERQCVCVCIRYCPFISLFCICDWISLPNSIKMLCGSHTWVCLFVCVWVSMFFLHHIYALVPGLHFCVKIVRFMPDLLIFFDKKKKKMKNHIFHSFSMWGHIDPEDHKCKMFFYMPSEQPNQAQFFVCV